MTKQLLFICILFSISCQSNTTKQDEAKAKRYYSEGMNFLSNRISIQSKDKDEALALNKKAIEMFGVAYQADTLFAKAVFFASECTMYASDYIKCIYWTSKLMQLDTSRQNLQFCLDRIEYCNEQITEQSQSD